MDAKVAAEAEASGRFKMGARGWHVLSRPSARSHSVPLWFGISPNLFCPFLSAVPRAARPAATFTGNVPAPPPSAHPSLYTSSSQLMALLAFSFHALNPRLFLIGGQAKADFLTWSSCSTI